MAAFDPFSLPYVTPIRAADLWENGRASTTSPTWPGGVQFVGDTGGPGESYLVSGTGARARTASIEGTQFALDVASTWTSTGANNRIGIRVNDGVTTYVRDGVPTHIQDISLGAARGKSDGSVNFETIPFTLDPGTKRLEIVVPAQHATSASGQPSGIFPIRLRSNREVLWTTPTAQTFRLGICGDSIAVGGNAVIQQLLGFAGLFKRGLTCQFGTLWKGAYSGATTYAVGDLVSSGAVIWQKISTAAAGTAPAVGANWNAYGFNGSVELFRSWGTKQVATDWSSDGNGTSYAAEIAARNYTHLLLCDGSNDHSVIPPTTLANFNTYEARRYTKLAAVQAGLKIVALTMFLRGTNGTEGANSNGNTMGEFRTARVNQVAAASGFSTAPISLDGSTMWAVGDLNDWVHGVTGTTSAATGHAKLPNLILPNFV